MSTSTADDIKFTWTGLPPNVIHLLEQAVEHWEDDDVAESFIRRALEQSQEMQVLMSAYRFYFYKAKKHEALEIAEKILTQTSLLLGMTTSDWHEFVEMKETREEKSLDRVYLATYGAKGLLLAQLGHREEANIICERVKQFDPRREFCATTVAEVLAEASETAALP